MNGFRGRAALLVLGTALFFVIGVATTSASPSKPYSVVMTTDAGGSGLTVTAVITNENTTQQLGSADLTPPSAYSLSGTGSTSVGTFSVAHNIVDLRNLNLAPGKSATVTIGVASSPCSAGTWASEAKQSNDFSGIPGNALTLDVPNSNLVTTLCSAPCKSGGLCTTKTSNSGGSAEIAASKGKLTGTLIESASSNDSPGSVPLVCSNYTSADANTYSFDAPPDRTKVVSITIRSSTFLDLGAQQICANLPFRFTTFSGALAAADMTFGGFTGLLPDCSGRGAPPCHDRRHDSEATDPAGGFNIVLVADLPAAAGDPRMN